MKEALVETDDPNESEENKSTPIITNNRHSIRNLLGFGKNNSTNRESGNYTNASVSPPMNESSPSISKSRTVSMDKSSPLTTTMSNLSENRKSLRMLFKSMDIPSEEPTIVEIIQPNPISMIESPKTQQRRRAPPPPPPPTSIISTNPFDDTNEIEIDTLKSIIITENEVKSMNNRPPPPPPPRRASVQDY